MKAFKDFSDAELVTLICDQDRTELFSILYQRHYSQVLCTCLKIVKDNELAQDFAQDTMVKAITQLPTLRQRNYFGTWLIRIAHNKSLDHFKKKTYQMTFDEVDTNLFQEDPEDRERLIEKEERLDRLEAILSQLKEKDRILLTQKYLLAHSLRKMQGDQLSTSAVKMRLNRAKKRALKLYQHTQ